MWYVPRPRRSYVSGLSYLGDPESDSDIIEALEREAATKAAEYSSYNAELKKVQNEQAAAETTLNTYIQGAGRYPSGTVNAERTRLSKPISAAVTKINAIQSMQLAPLSADLAKLQVRIAAAKSARASKSVALAPAQVPASRPVWPFWSPMLDAVAAAQRKAAFDSADERAAQKTRSIYEVKGGQATVQAPQVSAADRYVDVAVEIGQQIEAHLDAGDKKAARDVIVGVRDRLAKVNAAALKSRETLSNWKAAEHAVNGALSGFSKVKADGMIAQYVEQQLGTIRDTSASVAKMNFDNSVGRLADDLNKMVNER